MTTCKNCPLKVETATHHECPIRGVLDSPDMEACKIGADRMAKDAETGDLMAIRQAEGQMAERAGAQAPVVAAVNKGPK